MAVLFLKSFEQGRKPSLVTTMEWILIAGIVLTSLGILVGLYLPVLAAEFVVRGKVRVCAIVGAVLVVIGTAMEIVSVWPCQDIDAEQTTPE
jgi:hypothetical protein